MFSYFVYICLFLSPANIYFQECLEHKPKRTELIGTWQKQIQHLLCDALERMIGYGERGTEDKYMHDTLTEEQ